MSTPGKTGKRSYVSVIVGILISSTVLKNLKVARTLAMGVVAALVIVGMAGSAGAAPYAYIPNSQSNTVSVIDTATNSYRHCACRKLSFWNCNEPSRNAGIRDEPLQRQRLGN